MCVWGGDFPAGHPQPLVPTLGHPSTGRAVSPALPDPEGGRERPLPADTLCQVGAGVKGQLAAAGRIQSDNEQQAGGAAGLAPIPAVESCFCDRVRVLPVKKAPTASPLLFKRWSRRQSQPAAGRGCISSVSVEKRTAESLPETGPSAFPLAQRRNCNNGRTEHEEWAPGCQLHIPSSFQQQRARGRSANVAKSAVSQHGIRPLQGKR